MARKNFPSKGGASWIEQISREQSARGEKDLPHWHASQYMEQMLDGEQVLCESFRSSRPRCLVASRRMFREMSPGVWVCVCVVLCRVRMFGR